MSIADFKNKLAQAKQAQAASAQNENLRDHIGEQMVVSGMQITHDIEIKSAGLVLDKVTFLLPDGSAIDGFHLAAVEKAKELIEVLGEGPYPIPLLMEIREVETKRGPKQYAHLIDFAATPSEISFADLEEDLEPLPDCDPSEYDPEQARYENEN